MLLISTAANGKKGLGIGTGQVTQFVQVPEQEDHYRLLLKAGHLGLSEC